MARRGKASLARAAAAGAWVLLMLVAGARAQSYSVLSSFDGSDGSLPYAPPLVDSSGNVFGTTPYGGSSGFGVVYELVNNGGGNYTNTTLYSFSGGNDGGCPMGGLLRESSGDLYGAGYCGGAYGAGVVYELVNSGGTYTENVIHSFAGTDGAQPYGTLAMDASGRLYGTTYSGGGGGCSAGCGTVFQLSKTGSIWKEKVLHIFKDDGTDGWYPQDGVTLDAKGNLYGTTYDGGSYQYGTVFRLSPPAKGKKDYTETILHTFADPYQGCSPESGVALDPRGDLYGTASSCGTYGAGVVYQLRAIGTAYRYRVILQFDGSNGHYPLDLGKLAIDSSNDVYGTAFVGGAFNNGVVFELVPTKGGKFSYINLHDFGNNDADGVDPGAGASLNSSGSLYGTTTYGGGSSNCTSGCGTVWQITIP